MGPPRTKDIMELAGIPFGNPLSMIHLRLGSSIGTSKLFVVVEDFDVKVNADEDLDDFFAW